MGQAQAAPGGAESSGARAREDAEAALRPISASELARHASAQDCWVGIEGRVYNVTRFLSSHPGGGAVIANVAGTDATAWFDEANHSHTAREMMKEYLVGRLVSDEEAAALLARDAAAGEPAPHSSEPAAAAAEPQRPAAGATMHAQPPAPQAAGPAASEDRRVLVLYASLKGATRDFARRFAEATRHAAAARGGALRVDVLPMSEFDPEDLPKERVVVLMTSTYSEGSAPESARFFFDWLQEATVDFRVGEEFLASLRFAVFGCGDSLYDEHFNAAAKRLRAMMLRLKASELLPLGLADSSVSRDDLGTADTDFRAWCAQAAPAVAAALLGAPAAANAAAEEYEVLSDGDDAAPAPAPAPAKPAAKGKAKSKGEAAAGDVETEREKVVDVEDLGAAMEAARRKKRPARQQQQQQQQQQQAPPAVEVSVTRSVPRVEGGAAAVHERVAERLRRRQQQAAAEGLERKSKGEADPIREGDVGGGGDAGGCGSDAESGGDEAAVDDEDEEEERKAIERVKKGEFVRPMITDQLRDVLSQQGYKLIGTHSGVKLCRWTKAMLRGRGGCYKHTFYGIQSFQCMEMTPSLACANKCVFCWRHHSNPVGRDWKWQVDDPEMIVEAAIGFHHQMVKQMRGVPGVRPERLEEAARIRHCALSLVGEPIMYPHINRFVRLLHGRHISTFLVTNAQFPDRIRDMEPVTQLYVSIDASTQDSLKAVDRPLFKDFWERYLASLRAVRDKPVRTVYRLTLVKAMNMSEVAEYAKLVALGRPTFVEIKGVTFCGTSEASNLTMKQVPFHHEVRLFAQKLCSYLSDEYDLACEHVHSCCILIAHKSLHVDGKWRTWIDYERFQQLVHEFYRTGKPFSAVDYSAETPSWAVFGAKEEGFDPAETRFFRNKVGGAAALGLERLAKERAAAERGDEAKEERA
jgi:wyosine [tRNA(Phe)-imidazoG37] synthetase (radical SAM superfamily)/flavodoxin